MHANRSLRLDCVLLEKAARLLLAYDLHSGTVSSARDVLENDEPQMMRLKTPLCELGLFVHLKAAHFSAMVTDRAMVAG